jgi:histidinol-phosphatase
MKHALRDQNPHPESDFQWTIDPIDGTKNFLHGMITPACLIGLLYNGHPTIGIVTHPLLNLVYSAGVGLGAFCNNEQIFWKKESQKNPLIFSGSRSTYVKTGDERLFDRLLQQYPDTQVYTDPFSQTQAVHGRVGCVVEFNLKIWDMTPIQVLLKEVGGKHHIIKTVELQGTPKLFSFIFGRPYLVDHLLPLFV